MEFCLLETSVKRQEVSLKRKEIQTFLLKLQFENEENLESPLIFFY